MANEERPLTSPTQYFTGLQRYGRKVYANVWDSYLNQPQWVLLPCDAVFKQGMKIITVDGVGTINYDPEAKYFIHRDEVNQHTQSLEKRRVATGHHQKVLRGE